ncbi:hypothetical protein BY996DRAFT_6408362 [Phakopsora pachyrhizi]|nr:hypothetical protein BY996DRAFT_6408362 [Phakopsora pachyrhizi]
MYTSSARQKLQGKPQGTFPEVVSSCSGRQANSLAGPFGDLFLGRTSLALEHGIGVILRTSALKSSNLRDSSLRHLLTICDRLASGTFLRLSGAYTCTGLASGTSKSSSYCAAAAAAQVASYMEVWVLH